MKMAKTCLLDMKPFSTSRILRLSKGSMYFFSFSWGGAVSGVTKGSPRGAPKGSQGDPERLLKGSPPMGNEWNPEKS